MGFSVDEDPLAVHRLHVRVVPQDEREVSTARVCGPGRDHPRVRVVLGSSSRRAVDAASRQHVLDGPSSAVCSQLRDRRSVVGRERRGPALPHLRRSALGQLVQALLLSSASYAFPFRPRRRTVAHAAHQSLRSSQDRGRGSHQWAESHQGWLNLENDTRPFPHSRRSQRAREGPPPNGVPAQLGGWVGGCDGAALKNCSAVTLFCGVFYPTFTFEHDAESAHARVALAQAGTRAHATRASSSSPPPLWRGGLAPTRRFRRDSVSSACGS